MHIHIGNKIPATEPALILPVVDHVKDLDVYLATAE